MTWTRPSLSVSVRTLLLCCWCEGTWWCDQVQSTQHNNTNITLCPPLMRDSACLLLTVSSEQENKVFAQWHFLTKSNVWPDLFIGWEPWPQWWCIGYILTFQFCETPVTTAQAVSLSRDHHRSSEAGNNISDKILHRASYLNGEILSHHLLHRSLIITGSAMRVFSCAEQAWQAGPVPGWG